MQNIAYKITGDVKMSESKSPITVLISAVGGQGGQLFAQWLFDTAKEAGFFPAGVGLPGLSQREGATVYYLEFFAHPDETSFFSPFPEKGRVQVLIGLELLELLRAIQAGYLSKDGVVVGSTHRVLTPDEKLPIKGGFVSSEQALEVLSRAAKRLIAFDAIKATVLAGLSQQAANAILLGAIAASRILPFPTDAFRKAIEQYGVAVHSNLRAFEFGLEYPSWLKKLDQVDSELVGEWEWLPDPNLPETVRKRMDALSVDHEIASILQQAARWLCHYQNVRYFTRYLDCVQAVLERDKEHSKDLVVTREVARILALRMTYEDAIRVAQLKTQKRRFARIREEHHIPENAIYRVIDFFSLDWDELIGLLPLGTESGKNESVSPTGDGEGLPPLPFESDELKRPTLQLRWETSSTLGYFILKVLSLLKPLRPISRRFKREWKWINQWLSAVEGTLDENYDLALIIARSGEMVRGYGRTRKKTLKAWQTFMAFLKTLRRRGMPIEKIVSLGEQFLSLALSGPKGPEKAWQFAKGQIERMSG